MFLCGVLCFVGAVTYVTAQQVNITNGVIQGRQEYSQRGIYFYAFQQIPFAKPPIGPLRFKEPQPAEKWEGVLDATKNDKMCFQQINLYSLTDKSLLENEDCLYLNVYTPVKPSTNVSLPVIFYIYGGGYGNGAANFDFYGPHYWMEHGIVLVTINYRVGAFGFLSTGDTVIPGNYGLKDQQLGLKWVQENIKYFGGDPTKVTILGQSAGGSSVTFQIMNKKNEGLFRAAISQSGSTISPWAYQSHHKELAHSLATSLNPNFNPQASSEELLEFLRSIPAKDLNDAVSADLPPFWNQILQGGLFTPVIEPEHENAFITERMYDAIENGHMQKVPLIMGMCSEEMVSYAAADLNDFETSTTKTFDNNLTLLVNDNMHLTDEAERQHAGVEIKKMYTNSSFYDHPGKLLQFLSDASFGRAIIHHAKLQSKFSDVYFYQFSYIGSISEENSYVPEANRVGHSDDNTYIWVTNNNSNLNEMPQGDILTSERYRILITNFAKNLDPVSEKTDVLGITSWPTVKPHNFQYLDINQTLTIQKDLKKDVYEGWVDVYNRLAVKPYYTF